MKSQRSKHEATSVCRSPFTVQTDGCLVGRGGIRDDEERGGGGEFGQNSVRADWDDTVITARTSTPAAGTPRAVDDAVY